MFLPQLFYLSSPDTLSTPPHCYVDSDLHRFPSFSRGFVHFSTSWLCCYRFWDLSGCPRRDSALPTGGVRFGSTMASTDSLQTDYSAAFSLFRRGSQDKAHSFHTAQAEFTMRTLDRVSGVSIHSCLTSCTLAFYSLLVNLVCVSSRLPPPHTLLWRICPWLFDSALTAAHWGLSPQLCVTPDVLTLNREGGSPSRLNMLSDISSQR